MDNRQQNQPRPTPPPTTHQTLGVHMPTNPQPPVPHTPTPPLPESPSPEQHPKEPSKKPASSSSAPKLVIVVALLITLSLAAMAVMAYRQNDIKPKPSAHQDSGHVTTPPATTKDVDAADQAIDEALEAADMAEELPEDDLQNQTLGL